jgi:hypothetical protein
VVTLTNQERGNIMAKQSKVKSKEKCWTTKDGQVIRYSKLEDSHLDNIIRYLERAYVHGVVTNLTTQNRCKDTIALQVEMKGDEVYTWFDYAGLCAEQARRLGKHIIIFNARYSEQVIVNGATVDPVDFISKHAKQLGYTVVRKGNGTKLFYGAE